MNTIQQEAEAAAARGWAVFPTRPDGKPGAPQVNYLAHAVRAFFDNGGRKLYVTRVYDPPDPDDPTSGQATFFIGSRSVCNVLVTQLSRNFPAKSKRWYSQNR